MTHAEIAQMRAQLERIKGIVAKWDANADMINEYICDHMDDVAIDLYQEFVEDVRDVVEVQDGHDDSRIIESIKAADVKAWNEYMSAQTPKEAAEAWYTWQAARADLRAALEATQ